MWKWTKEMSWFSSKLSEGRPQLLWSHCFCCFETRRLWRHEWWRWDSSWLMWYLPSFEVKGGPVCYVKYCSQVINHQRVEDMKYKTTGKLGWVSNKENTGILCKGNEREFMCVWRKRKYSSRVIFDIAVQTFHLNTLCNQAWKTKSDILTAKLVSDTFFLMMSCYLLARLT
jgi:hypothetical protein